MYHVMFAANDVRQMTLDQVDDCFRLGVINEDTWLWTEGMIKWETLKEAAGLTEPTRNAPPPPRRGAQPPSSRRVPKAEPPPRRRPNKSVRGGSSPEVITSARPLEPSRPVVTRPPHHAAPALSVLPPVPAPPTPAPSAVPSYQPRSPAPPIALAPQAQHPAQAQASWFPGADMGAHYAPASSPQSAPHQAVQQYNPFMAYPQSALQHAQPAHTGATSWGANHPALASGVRQVPASYPSGYPATHSLMPVAAAVQSPNFDLSGLDDAPFGKRRGGGVRFQRWVTAVCLLAGAGVVAYRNDYLLHIAKSARVESAYLALERKYLGGAPQGTLRSVQGMMTSTNTVVQKWTLPTETVVLGSGVAAASLPATVPDGPDAPLKMNSAAADTPSTPTTTLGDVAPGSAGGAVAQSASAKAEADPTSRSTDGLRAVGNSASNSRSVSAPSTSASRYTKTSEESTSSKPGMSKAFRESLASYNSRKRGKSETSESSEDEASARSEPAPTPGTDDFLHMNMRQAIKKKSSAASASSSNTPKKRASKADYDPLNGDL